MAVLVLVLVGCGTSMASGTGRCGPASARTIGADASARVYSQNGSVYGCSTKNGRTSRLGSSSATLGQGRVGLVKLAGANAAYVLTFHGVDTGNAEILVRRLTDGTVLHTAPAVSRVGGPESFQAVDSLVVKADGAVAWIGAAHSIVGHGAGVIEVHRIDSRGKALLDQGGGISPVSLRLHLSRLSWSESGRERVATLR